MAEFVEPETVEKCRLDKLLPVSMSTKSFIERHLNRIHHSNDVSKVDVISGFGAALKMVERSNLEKSENVQASNPINVITFSFKFYLIVFPVHLWGCPLLSTRGRSTALLVEGLLATTV